MTKKIMCAFGTDIDGICGPQVTPAGREFPAELVAAQIEILQILAMTKYFCKVLHLLVTP